jgi:hypothetical protein
MIRRFLNYFLYSAIITMAQISACADPAPTALTQSIILENDVTYLRVTSVAKDLLDQIKSAEPLLTASNSIGTILDLRFADGDDSDSAKAIADLFVSKKLPLVILVNDATHGAAAKLAANLHDARAGLIFGSSTEVKPDVMVEVKIEDEKNFLKNPYEMLAASPTNAVARTNHFLSFVDHISEADLVRAKVKDGENPLPLPAIEAHKPFIRDPVLARAVDLMKGLAIVRQQQHS